MRHMYSLTTAIATLVLAACGVASSQEPTATPNVVQTIQPTPLSIVSFEERLLATIDIEYPDDIAFAQGFIWVKTDTGHVIQVDPATNSVVNDLEVDTTSDRWHYCQGLGTDGAHVWACSASGDENHRTIDVVRIDPSSQSVVTTFKVDKVFDQHDMPFLLNHIWVLTDNGNKLVGLDTTTNQPTPAIDLGVRCFQAAASGTSLLVTCKLDNVILVIDPVRMEITERVAIPRPVNIAATSNGIWVLTGSDVVRLDPETLLPVVTFARLGSDAGFSASAEAVWVRVTDGFVYRIDPIHNQLIEQISNDRNLTWGNILATPDSLWVSVENNESGLLLRFDL